MKNALNQIHAEMKQEQTPCLATKESRDSNQKNDSKFFFTDNLEHLQALELEAKILIVAACLRMKKKSGAVSCRTTGEDKDLEDIPEQMLSLVSGKKDITTDIAKVRKRHCQAVRNSLAKGISLNFETVCEKYGLNDFERQILLILFVHSTSMEFREMLESCSIGHWKFDDDGITTGTVLSILCPEYRGQIINRKYFSIENPLVKHEIVIPQGFYNNKNIMDVDIEIHERITNFILGDNNKYDNDLSCISTEKIKVNLDRVIMESTLKNDIVRLAENYSSLAGKRQDFAIDSFYGYGTGLTFLFFGPSGTGKTMLAHGLATHLGKNLLSLNMAGLSSQNLSFDDAVKYMFREARLSNGIVFLDECDDLLKDNSHDSRTFLIEIEKAECITIMASNKVTTLDPALDRRISMKVPFSLPDESERSEIWQSLIPPGVAVSDTVDFQILSKKYVFSGGLIKNTIFMAINNMMSKNSKGDIRLSSDALIQAADYQTKSMFDQNDFGETYLPHTGFDELGVKKLDRHKMKQFGTLYERLRQENLGMSCVLTVSDLQTGIKCVEAVASMCGTEIRCFSLTDVLWSSTADTTIRDPFTQKELTKLEYAFQGRTGHEDILLLVDHDSIFNESFKNKDKQSGVTNSKFLEKIRTFKGMVFVVTDSLTTRLPMEFACSFSISFPSEESQIQHWESYLKAGICEKECVIDLVEQFPMYFHEIDQIARHAKVAGILDNRQGNMTLADIYRTIKKLRQKQSMPLLFGAA